MSNQNSPKKEQIFFTINGSKARIIWAWLEERGQTLQEVFHEPIEAIFKDALGPSYGQPYPNILFYWMPNGRQENFKATWQELINHLRADYPDVEGDIVVALGDDEPGKGLYALLWQYEGIWYYERLPYMPPRAWRLDRAAFILNEFMSAWQPAPHEGCFPLPYFRYPEMEEEQ
jgi:hypothetical protein